VITDRYGMTIVDFKRIGYKDEPFVLAKDTIQMFYVKDMSSKPKKDMSSKSKNNEPAMLYKQGYCSCNVALSSHLSSQNLICDLSLTMKVPKQKNFHFTFIRLVQK
jgi:hypothetical protein